MKVLFINTVFGRGSTGRIVKDLGEALEKEGHEYVALYGRKPISDDKHAVFIGGKFDAYIHAGLARITDRAGFYSKRATLKAVEFIKQYNPDIIHLHNLHGYYINIEVLFNYLKNEFKGRVIWTLHDCWAYTGHCVHYSYARCDKWMTGCYGCLEKKSYPTAFVDNSKNNYVDKKRIFSGVPNMTVVTVSDWLKNEVKKSFLKQYKLIRIYNGVDVSKFHYVENDIKAKYNATDKKIILSVSDGWNDRKGYEKIINVAKIAPKEWLFIIVGLDREQINRLPKNIIGINHVWNQDELIKYYSAADVFFNPSVEETFGLVTAEAVACGTPAVVMNTTACPEVIYSEDVGEIVNVDLDNSNLIARIQQCFLKKNTKVVFFRFEKTYFYTSYFDVYKNY